MNYKLDVTKEVLEFIEGLDPKRLKQALNKTPGLLENPYPNDNQKLLGYEYYRTDIGEYRIIYRLDKDTVRIALIGQRNDDKVYKPFEPKQK